MQLILQRAKTINNTQLGELFVNNKFFCYTLEDKIRDVKIKHETCIPEGTYNIILNLSQRFKTILPLLQNVPQFEGIRIHAGNTTEDTSGCILVGSNINGETLLHSKTTLQQLLLLFQKAIKASEKIEIIIRNPVELEVPNGIYGGSGTVLAKPDEVTEPMIPVTEITQETQFTFKQFIQWILELISKNW